jgi:hypothetical protein
MKIFNKFASKNVGKPGSTRRWGGGLLLACVGAWPAPVEAFNLDDLSMAVPKVEVVLTSLLGCPDNPIFLAGSAAASLGLDAPFYLYEKSYHPLCWWGLRPKTWAQFREGFDLFISEGWLDFCDNVDVDAVDFLRDFLLGSSPDVIQDPADVEDFTNSGQYIWMDFYAHNNSGDIFLEEFLHGYYSEFHRMGGDLSYVFRPFWKEEKVDSRKIASTLLLGGSLISLTCLGLWWFYSGANKFASRNTIYKIMRV